MRTFKVLFLFGLGTLISVGAAQAEAAFPRGIDGRGDFSSLPRWQRVLSAQSMTVDAAEPAALLTSEGSDTAGQNDGMREERSGSAPAFEFPSPAAYAPFDHFAIPLPLARPRFVDNSFIGSGTQSDSSTAGMPSVRECLNEQVCENDLATTTLEAAGDLAPRAQIEWVNTWANKVKYVEDFGNWGVNDYWQTPDEFVSNGGDCEDYAILKYFSLSALGFSANDMRILVVFDEELALHHAVLLVRIDENIWVLDNQNSTVVGLQDIGHYRPIYSVNESNWWLHKTLTPIRVSLAGPTKIRNRSAGLRRRY